MSSKLSGLIAGIKRSVIDAHRHVSNQHMDELENFFKPAAGQDPDLVFPNGEWEAQTVTMVVPREVSRNGVITMENINVNVPLITLLPLKSLLLERIEIITTLDLSLSGLSEEVISGEQEIPPDVLVSFSNTGPNAAEIKIVIQAAELPAGYTRLVGAYEKLLNAQLPN